MSSDLTLELFVAGAPVQSALTRERINALLDRMPTIRYRLDVIDVLESPQLADLAHILVTPTLVIRAGDSERRLVGDLSDLTRLQLLITEAEPG
jgi:circadian clock protein KaiB